MDSHRAGDGVNYFLAGMYFCVWLKVCVVLHFVLCLFVFVVLCIVRAAARASSVEVFFIDAELVTNKLYGSRWEELSCGRDTEDGDFLSVCEHPSAE